MEWLQNDSDLAVYLFGLLVFGVFILIAITTLATTTQQQGSFVDRLLSFLIYSLMVGGLLWLVIWGPRYCGESVGNFFGSFKKGYKESSERND